MVALIALRVMNKNGYSTGVLWTGRVGGAAWVAPKACRRMYVWPDRASASAGTPLFLVGS